MNLKLRQNIADVLNIWNLKKLKIHTVTQNTADATVYLIGNKIASKFTIY